MASKSVTLRGVTFEILTGRPIPPPPKLGRHKSVNNDDELVARALVGLKTGEYKNCTDAAQKLSADAMMHDEDGKWYATGATSVDRLRRKIGKARKGKAY